MAAVLFLAILFGLAAPASAYVGPGAGFAFVSAAFVYLAALLLSVIALLTWPIRVLLRLLVGKRRRRVPGVRRVIVLGFDGQDAALTESLLAEGLLPNFSRLREQGCFASLATTLPASSPVAWSSFMTGCNPGKHRIFDFLTPNRRTLLPELSSARVAAAPRCLRVGKYRIPLSRPRLSASRRSRTFWSILGQHGVFSTVIRVPLTFPPEPFDGLLLSGAFVPDLRGSQGSYLHHTSAPSGNSRLAGGRERPLVIESRVARGTVPGPENSFVAAGGELEVPFQVLLPVEGKTEHTLRIGEETHQLRLGEYTDWVTVAFRAAPGVRVRGICRFLLLETGSRLRLYMTPLQIDPGHPALPISHPPAYTVYLAKAQGPFATLGVAEDVTACNEGILGEADFLAQCRLVHAERETMFFDALDKTHHGALVCVFDLLDRVQHLCFRGIEGGGGGADHPVRAAYRTMDALLGRVLDRADRGTIVMVLSDHGFRSFRRAVDLNAWLREEGLLAVHEQWKGEDMLRAIDWSRTQAYAVGFGGIYLNRRGREAQGIVDLQEVPALKARIRERLQGLRDPILGGEVVQEVFDRDEVYRGPYVEDAPELIAGFNIGYRASWTSVTGGVGALVFEDNLRPWSGDHNLHPSFVPGVFFCNRTPDRREGLHIVDIAPTILTLFGVPVPPHMDGRAISLATGPGVRS